jgi:4-hydroxythreonine-4-phosphate dehydrogenase
MSKSEKPLLAVTMGDAAGVGPEVIVGAWDRPEIHEAARPLVVGHGEIMRRAVWLLQRDVTVVDVDSSDRFDEVVTNPSTMPCLRGCDDGVLKVAAGQVDPRSGEAAYQAVRLAARLALESRVDGIVTAPLSKAALHAAGHEYPGHTELLAELCGVSDFAMMLYLQKGVGCRVSGVRGDNPVFSDTRHLTADTSLSLGIVHVTLHQSLRSVFADLTTPAIVAKCRLVDGVMRRLGVARPRLAVCALNPHAGEEGLFGDEERTIIAPAVDEARRAGLDVAGPFPTDTLMARAAGGEFDAVVAMYHDQGHIAIKLLGMHAAVNITLGLPLVRTSVAHGTAFDRAWQGTANSDGMVAAIQTAARLARTL